jgi:hypothetical protein
LCKNNAIANHIKAIVLLMTILPSLYYGYSSDLAGLLYILPSKISPSDGLDEKYHISCFQIPSAVVLGFQILLDYNRVSVKTASPKIL